MAEDQDASQKTEDPTSKRLDDAAKKGDVAVSQEVKHWFSISGAVLVLAMFAGPMARKVAGTIMPFLEAPQDIPLDVGHLVLLLRNTGLTLGLITAPAVAVFLLAALGGNILQKRPQISLERLKPNFARLSPLAGVKNLFSMQGLLMLGKSLVKFAVLGFVVWYVVWPRVQGVPLMIGRDEASILPLTKDLVMIMLMAVLAVTFVMAAGDLVYQKWDNLQKLRMSKQEVRDEMKQNDGDPMVKQRIRSIRSERSRKRMMAAVPEADVVVTNPTHFAVAMKYDPATMQAPKVLAKGQDLIALRIRGLAESHKVPIVENPPLARALYAACEIDREIPVEHYRAVAEIIGYVMRLKGKLPARPAAGS